MTSIQKAPWNRLGEEASRTYQAQKNLQRSNVVQYSLSDTGRAAAAKLKKKAVATATAAASKTKKVVATTAKTKKVTPAKSAAVKKSTAKKVTVKKSTKTAKVSVSTARLRYAVI